MKTVISICFLVFLSVFSSHAQAQVLPTKLRVTVIDNLGNFVEGAQVTIFASEEDYRNNTNPITCCPTDKKGRVTFEGLQAISYFIDASKGDQNNNGEGVKTAPLVPKKLNKVNTVIQ